MGFPVRDNWNFNASNPVVYVGGNYNQNTNHGMFYVNYTNATNANANLGCRTLLEARLTLDTMHRIPHSSC